MSTSDRPVALGRSSVLAFPDGHDTAALLWLCSFLTFFASSAADKLATDVKQSHISLTALISSYLAFPRDVFDTTSVFHIDN